MRIPSFIRRLPADQLLWVSSVSLALGVGLLSGAVFGMFLATDGRPPVVRAASGSSVATIVMEGFRDGALRGQAEGELRLYARDEAVDVGPDGRFSIDQPWFRIEDVTVPVPPGMRFVASKKGKKYYAVDSASGERIAPENRVYFRDAGSAEAAGFVK